MVLKAKPAWQCGKRSGYGILLACLLVFALMGGVCGWSQGHGSAAGSSAGGGLQATKPEATKPSPALDRWEGLPVRSISFEGVSTDRLTPLPGHLAQAVGAPLSQEELGKSLRQLFSTGLFETLTVEGERKQDGVALIFRGLPRAFIGAVSVEGAKGASVNIQLLSASQLAAGTRLTSDKLSRAREQMSAILAQDGFHKPVITQTLTPRPAEQLVDIAFHVVSGPQARVGAVTITGDAGMTPEEFRSHARLRPGMRVNRETASRALAGMLKVYQREQRLEAQIKLEPQQYDAKANTVSYRFSAQQGPVVKVGVEGANIGSEQLKRLIPIFEEGSVDEDLLNEGNRRLRDFFQQRGYFDVKVTHEKRSPSASLVMIVYDVRLGARRRVERVSVTGNHYFSSATLDALLGVHAADVTDRHGIYSQALVSADAGAIEAVYRNNGFSKVKITPETSAGPSADSGSSPLKPQTAPQTAPLTVTYHIEEGPQLRVGTVRIEGNEQVDASQLTPQLNTIASQPLSPGSLAGDRDTLLTDYLSRGFDRAVVQVAQQTDPADPSKVNVVFQITEGRRIFVRKVLLTGLHYTRPATAEKAITLNPGDPLNQTALTASERNLYDLSLFNEVNTAIENPSGESTHKTILIQTEEARRWTLTYGFGFEAQTGQPRYNCQGAIAAGVACNPNGKTGVSPRVLAAITRNNFLGRDQSVSLRGNYGLLEQKLDLLFQIPHFEQSRNFSLTFSGGYANSVDVSTYVSSRLEGGMHWTEHFNTPGSVLSKANTFVYEFDFRRVKVQASSLQVYPDAIAALATAVRVAGPSVTWIRDTRDSPLDAHHGTYTSIQEFLSSTAFGAQANFNRLDLSNSSYYSFGKGRYVLARNTRYAQERAFGAPQVATIPLPERLYAGGATSLRGFAQNSAGPRDPETGYPIGGAGALIESTELRLPPPNLPWFGNTLSFVLFEDMGNVFTNAGDAWASIGRFHQPNRAACKTLASPANYPEGYSPSGPETSTGHQGTCSFNYFSQTPGIGLRYHTPVGPIRLDFSYDLNPPIDPVNTDYSLPSVSTSSPVPSYDLSPHVGETPRFNFFFSLGQSF
jgi:outer membrane protein assembly complex protein YaeT